MDKLTEYILLKEKNLSEVIDPFTIAISAIATSIPVLYVLLKDIKDAEREKIKRQCGKYKGKDYKKCKYTVILKMQETFLSKISSYKSKCPKQKNPQKCIAKLQSVEQRLKRTIPTLKSKIASL